MDDLYHDGVLERSGRYPWGSGGRPYQRLEKFLGDLKELQKQGYTESEIADAFKMTIQEFRDTRTVYRAEYRTQLRARALYLTQEKGMSITAAAEELGLKNESSLRSILKPAAEKRDKIINNTATLLRETLDQDVYVDIGPGSEAYLGIPASKLKAVSKQLEFEGYTKHQIKVTQLPGDGEQKTTITLMAKPGVTTQEIYQNLNKIGVVNGYLVEGGTKIIPTKPPTNVSSKKVAIRYAEDGGKDKDGVIELRPGVESLSLGSSRYAQVRIAVDGTHYLKGMAVYGNDMPDGVDIVFNTNKTKDVPMLGTEHNSVLKPMKGEDNPFGSVVRQKTYVGKDGKQHQSPINLVREEGDWDAWDRNLASQMLSKQPLTLAKKQLSLSRSQKADELSEIMALTNPVVKKALLQEFADSVDADAVHLKAAAMPRSNWRVILPSNTLRDNEVYAPDYKNGETVVLIRYPHGGKFEIPELKVNNRNKEANSVLGMAKDAVAINSKVASVLSGADFDGDAVLVIPNNAGSVKTQKPLKGLKDFDPQVAYKIEPGSKGKALTSKNTGMEMGKITNLIADMTIQDAPISDITRAVKHSMVVIDSKKHNLDYKQSFEDNGIAALKKRYQGSENAGASTIVTRAKSVEYVDHRKPKYKINPDTGEKIFEPTGKTYTTPDGKTISKKTKSTRMYETKDAHELSSGTAMEAQYADYANYMKTLGNTARKEIVSTPNQVYNPQSKKAYQKQVDSLDAKLNEALKYAPLERQAQAIGTLVYKEWIREAKDNGETLTKADKTKLQTQAIAIGRAQSGSTIGDRHIKITPDEWEAIQAGAITNNKLESILKNTDSTLIRKYATPRDTRTMKPERITLAKDMLTSGYTQAEVAERLGVNVKTLKENL